MDKVYYIDMAKDFTDTPGGRYESDGKYSGEKFYKKFLLTNFLRANSTILVINLNGLYGLPPGFIDQSFGQLYREFGEIIFDKIKFISDEYPEHVNEIKNICKNK